MNQQVITTAPAGFRYRTAVVVLGLFAAVAIGVGVAVTALDSGGTDAPVQQAAPAAPVPPALQLCGNDATYLVAAVATMPGEVQAQVGANLSPALADALGHLAMFLDPSQLQTPDSATLGAIMTRVSREDRNAILSGLPEEQRAAAAASWQRANMAEYLSSTATPCS
jgi:hypothetical protein